MHACAIGLTTSSLKSAIILPVICAHVTHNPRRPAKNTGVAGCLWWPASDRAGPASVFPGHLASDPPGELFFRAGDDAQVAPLVLEAGHLEDGWRVAGPVCEFRLEQEQVLRSRVPVVHEQLRMSELPDRTANRKGQV